MNVRMDVAYRHIPSIPIISRGWTRRIATSPVSPSSPADGRGASPHLQHPHHLQKEEAATPISGIAASNNIR
jgi:hypothetical protein